MPGKSAQIYYSLTWTEGSADINPSEYGDPLAFDASWTRIERAVDIEYANDQADEMDTTPRDRKFELSIIKERPVGATIQYRKKRAPDDRFRDLATRWRDATLTQFLILDIARDETTQMEGIKFVGQIAQVGMTYPLMGALITEISIVTALAFDDQQRVIRPILVHYEPAGP